jgi:arginine/serine-rich splicing factor 4/5/6
MITGYADRRGPIRGNRRGTYDGPYGGGRGGRKREFPADLDIEVIEVSSNRLYVHNLAWRVSWQDLKDHFREAGEVVRAEIFTEGPGGRSKGCGIVEMASVDDAANAVEKLMDSELQGRRILIREDRESRRRGDEHRDDRGESLHRHDDAEDNEQASTPPAEASPDPNAAGVKDVTIE